MLFDFGRMVYLPIFLYLVFLPTFMVDFDGTCRFIHTTHGSYPMLDYVFFRIIRTRTGLSQSSPLFGARFWVACVEGHDGKHYVLATRQTQKTVGMVRLMEEILHNRAGSFSFNPHDLVR